MVLSSPYTSAPGIELGRCGPTLYQATRSARLRWARWVSGCGLRPGPGKALEYCTCKYSRWFGGTSYIFVSLRLWLFEAGKIYRWGPLPELDPVRSPYTLAALRGTVTTQSVHVYGPDDYTSVCCTNFLAAISQSPSLLGLPHEQRSRSSLQPSILAGPMSASRTSSTPTTRRPSRLSSTFDGFYSVSPPVTVSPRPP